MSYLGRYAPSPSGDLHLGNVLAAVVAWSRARQVGGKILLRMEDLDRAREVPGAAERILEDLARLELDFDAGPMHPTTTETYVQSSSQAHYESALAALASHRLVYACGCSRKELAQMASAPHLGEEGAPYPGRCRDAGYPLNDDKTARSWRFVVPPGEICFEDALQGRYCQEVVAEVGDFVVRRKDGMYAYQLAVVVDDARQGITEVVRGIDLMRSTPRQIHLYRALGQPVPRFAHIPLWVAPDGARLAKRNGAYTMRALMAAGESPFQILGRVGRALGVCRAGEKIRASDLSSRLTPDVLRVQRVTDEGPLPP